MITLKSANIAAEEILNQAKKLSDTEKNSKASAIRPRNRFIELEAFPPWQRAAILRECGASADRQWQLVTLCLVLTCAGLAAWFLFLPAEYQTGPIALALIFFIGAPFALVRQIYIQNRLRNLIDLWRAANTGNRIWRA